MRVFFMTYIPVIPGQDELKIMVYFHECECIWLMLTHTLLYVTGIELTHWGRATNICVVEMCRLCLTFWIAVE